MPVARKPQRLMRSGVTYRWNQVSQQQIGDVNSILCVGPPLFLPHNVDGDAHGIRVEA